MAPLSAKWLACRTPLITSSIVQPFRTKHLVDAQWHRPGSHLFFSQRINMYNKEILTRLMKMDSAPQAMETLLNRSNNGHDIATRNVHLNAGQDLNSHLDSTIPNVEAVKA